MANKISPVPFNGTKEQEQKLLEVIAAHKDTQGALISVLQQAQDIYGYLPIEVQKIIAEKMGVPLEEVYGVVSFYAQFSLNPKGKYKISVCLGTACYVKGAKAVLERIKKELSVEDGKTTPDGRFTLLGTRCLGCCGLAPVMTIDGEVYGRLVADDIPDILAKY